MILSRMFVACIVYCLYLYIVACYVELLLLCYCYYYYYVIVILILCHAMIHLIYNGTLYITICYIELYQSFSRGKQCKISEVERDGHWPGQTYTLQRHYLFHSNGSKFDVLSIKCQAMFGYAFVNFVDEPQAQRARQVFEG